MSADWIALRDRWLNGADSQICLEMRAVAYRAAYRVLRNHADAEDVAQEATMRVLPHLLKCPTEQALRGFVYKTAYRLALGRIPKPQPPLSESVDPATSSLRRLIIRQCFEELTLLQQKAIKLHCLGYKNAEIAGLLEKSYTQVADAKFNAREKLRTCLQKTGRGDG